MNDAQKVKSNVTQLHDFGGGLRAVYNEEYGFLMVASNGNTVTFSCADVMNLRDWLLTIPAHPPQRKDE